MIVAPNTTQTMTKKVVKALQDHIWLWFLPTAGLTILASAYAVLRQPSWQATQALLVREEAGGSDRRQGRFESVDTMKTAQETILEVARNKSVVEASLQSLGRPKRLARRQPWPQTTDIEALRDSISVSAPKGAEFGRTEVIYLGVRGKSPEEAVRRTKAVCDQLEVQLAKLRQSRAQSVLNELNQTVELARAELDRSADQLQKMEASVGPDLGELRKLNDAVGGEGNLQHTLNQIKEELMQAEAGRQANLKLHELLTQARQDPGKFLATPTSVLESQPALRKLREGLAEAQLRTSALLGRMRKVHPLAVAAIRSEEQIRQSLFAELSTALSGVETDLQVSESKAAALREQQLVYQQRLDRLAGLRVGYSNLVDAVRQRTEVLNRAEESLAEARASQKAAQQSSLITRFDEPQVGDKPVGPGRSTIVAAGCGGGLAIGVGLVLLTMPVTPAQGRRWSDYIGLGRRASDQGRGRRQNDQRATDRPAGSGRQRRAEDSPGDRRADDRRGAARG